MSFRTVYGNKWSEAGWRMCDRNECEVISVPGADVRFLRAMIVRKGDAFTVLEAAARYYHQHIEPLDLYREGVGDDWGWSAQNDTPDSNHLAGVALDFNAVQYPFRRRTMPQHRVDRCLDMEAAFEGNLFWGRHWSSSTDEMHWQLGVPEFDPDGVPNRKLAAFAKRLREGYLGVYGPPDPMAFPLPAGAYYGPLDGPAESVSGDYATDRQEWRDGLARWQAAAGLEPTGRYNEQVKAAATALQITNGWPVTGRVYPGEWDTVIRHGEKPTAPVELPGVEYADVSQWQAPISDSYPHPFVMFRACNGDTPDTHADENLEWAIRAVNDPNAALRGFGVYVFWRPGEDNLGTLKRVVGKPHPRMVVMVDVEGAAGSTKGAVTGDQSDGVNRLIEDVRAWLGDGRQVLGYHNLRADPGLWTRKPASGVRYVTPDYSAAKGQPRTTPAPQVIHQYTQTGRCAPWGNAPVDLNYFTGTTSQLMDFMGLENATTTPPAPGGEPGAGMTIKVRDLTGPGTSAKQFGVGGTDLGIAVRTADGRNSFIFGDTFESDAVGGPGWRSPVMLKSDDTSPAALNDGIDFHAAVGGAYARQLWAYNHDGPPWTNGGFSTVIPADAMTIGGRLYLGAIVNKGFGNVAWTEIAVSDDSGNTWANGGAAARRNGDYLGGIQQQMTFDHDPATGWVWIITSGFQRDKNAYLFRVQAGDFLDRAKWSSWGYDGLQWGWGNTPTPILPGGQSVGEMNLRLIQGNWVFTYFRTDTLTIESKVLAAPNGNMHTAPTTVVARIAAWGDEVADPGNLVPQLYGGYVVPGSTLAEMHYVVSQWNTGAGFPYRIIQLKAALTPVVPLPVPEPTEAELVAGNYRAARALAVGIGADVSALPLEPEGLVRPDAQHTGAALAAIETALEVTP